MRAIGEKIAANGIPEGVAPLVVGLTGGGNVAAGAREILDLLPHVDVDPNDLEAWIADTRRQLEASGRLKINASLAIGG